MVSDGQVVRKVFDGDVKKLTGKSVDKDGDVLDKIGNVISKAKRWEEDDAPKPEATDLSALVGMRVNKFSNVANSSGSIYGRLIKGNPKKLVGRMSDKDGNIRSESGDVVGHAELIPESERESQNEAPFAGFDGATVTNDGNVEFKSTVIRGLISGDAKKLFSKQVDEHGDVSRCAGKEIDGDGDVVDGKGNRVVSVTLLADIPPSGGPTGSPEEAEERKQLERDNKLAR